MTIFEQSRYYFNYELPNIIISSFEGINIFLSQYWWFFLVSLFLLFIVVMRSFKKNIKLQVKFKKYDDYFMELSKLESLREIELFLLESMKLIRAKFCTLYVLRGETYILLESNAVDKKSVSSPMRIGKKESIHFKKSGNFLVHYIISSSENYMLMYFTTSKIDIDNFKGYFNVMLMYYEQVKNIQKAQSAEGLVSATRDTSISLMKLQMDKEQFFKFFISLIIKITKAKGAKLLSKEGELIFEFNQVKNAQMQKNFYIRNTPYKLEFYDDTTPNLETITKIGTFLDMAGSFLNNIDKSSEMVQNYLSLLKFTNNAIELENIYYKNHSAIVQTVAYETAKSLFLSQDELDNISLGAYLHDIGMVGDILSLLDKDTLEKKDMNLIKEHPLIGSVIVEPISNIYPISDIIKYHHERFDGKGYPFGLKESQIPITAQTVALGEFYAGITGDRSYKKGKFHNEAVIEIDKLRNKMFSSVITDAFLDVEKSIKIKIEKIKAKDERDETEK
jgi:HD-GYP domain-containing protein (c-di-GMP phosphodiesterase class II)